MPGDPTDPTLPLATIPSFTSLSLRSAARKPRAVGVRNKPIVPAAKKLPERQPPQLALDLFAAAPEAGVEQVFQAPATATAQTQEPPVRVHPLLYTVRQLMAELRQHVEGAYAGLVNVEGEVSNCRPAASGHLYFTLKDGDAQLPAVMFRRQATLLGFKLKDGLAVEVRGRISVYETRGQLQLIAESLRPRGAGALQLAFEQLRDHLRREGLFDRPRTPLPPFPHCIGIVTSPHGAAIRDIIQVVRRRHARLNLLIYPAVMQGPQCASSVIAGVRWFNRHPDRVDLILVTRGGGSFEDLNGFNDERLARAIAASKLPVVAAIGHEVDHTIADFVADLRAPTPSAAAELITAAQHRIEERIVSLERRVLRAGEFHLLRARQRLARLSAGQVLARVRDSIGLREQRIDELRMRLDTAMERRLRQRAVRLAAIEGSLRRHDPRVRLALAQRRLAAAADRLHRSAGQIVAGRSSRLERTQARLDVLPEKMFVTPRRRLEHAALRLQALSPLAVLHRGYAIVFTERDGRTEILRDATSAAAGQEIRARLATGSLRATVTETESETQ